MTKKRIDTNIQDLKNKRDRKRGSITAQTLPESQYHH